MNLDKRVDSGQWFDLGRQMAHRSLRHHALSAQHATVYDFTRELVCLNKKEERLKQTLKTLLGFHGNPTVLSKDYRKQSDYGKRLANNDWFGLLSSC